MIRVAALVVAAIAGCSSSAPEKTETPVPVPSVPERASTAGDDLLAMVPSGADAILEIDLARLRANAVVGPVFRALAGGDESAPEGAAPRVDLFGVGDAILIASYDIGTDETERVVLIRGDGAAATPGAEPFGDNTAVIASDAMKRRMRAVVSGAEPALGSASQLLRLRALAMPEKAEGAALRVAAHLDWNARLALAKALDLDEVPVSVSVWGDVADDLAIVALVGGKDSTEGRVLAKSLVGLRDRLAAFRPIRRLQLGSTVRRASIENRGAAARLVLLVGPKRLERLSARLLSRLAPTETP